MADLVDQALVICFDTPNSFTGEDVVELHLHGSIAVVAAIVLRVLRRKGALRVLPNQVNLHAGRWKMISMDLAQVEGLADLIDAETEAQRKQALRVWSNGALGRKD